MEFGLWMFFIMLHRYMVSKRLKSKKSFFCDVITSVLYTQGSVCPSPMGIHKCMCSDQFCKIPRTYYIHTHTDGTYYVQKEWSHSLLLNTVQARQDWLIIFPDQQKWLYTHHWVTDWSSVYETTVQDTKLLSILTVWTF